MSVQPAGWSPRDGDLLRVERLAVGYRAGLLRKALRAVDDVSFAVAAGETLSIIGEAGSGKSTIGGAILGLRDIAGGSIHFRGNDITRASRSQRRDLRGQLQAVFQNPGASLDPARSVGDAIAEPLVVGTPLGRDEVRSRVAGVLEQFGLDPADSARYPNEFSVRQLQLVSIARAVVGRPALVICDEPTSALDPATRSRVFDILDDLQHEAGTSYLFFARDASGVSAGSGRVLTLAGGRLSGGERAG
jgi:ABC-type glutathione transport system ATPase component